MAGLVCPPTPSPDRRSRRRTPSPATGPEQHSPRLADSLFSDYSTGSPAQSSCSSPTPTGCFSKFHSDFNNRTPLGCSARASPEVGAVVAQKALDGMQYLILHAPLSEGTDRFGSRNHARACAADCPHVVRYYDTWVEADRVYVRLEHCEDGTLDAWLRSPDALLTEEDATKLVQHLTLGLHHLHALGIAHNGLSPQTCYVGRDWRGGPVFKIGDFDRSSSADEVSLRDDLRQLAAVLTAALERAAAPAKSGVAAAVLERLTAPGPLTTAELLPLLTPLMQGQLADLRERVRQARARAAAPLAG